MKHENMASEINLPPVIFGTSCLGNLYQELPYETKLKIVANIIRETGGNAVFDTAGKYGAGLALEVIGRCLKDLNIPAGNIVISNKLGWLRIPLKTQEPTFEPGAWKGLKHDAVQKISYDGILECHEQGCGLLGRDYKVDLVSVHDPDEYLAAAKDPENRKKRLSDIVGAYKALHELKEKGEVKAVGIGSKDWRVIRELDVLVKFDWVMLAVSFTIMQHPPELISFIDNLNSRNISIINSAVFHAGFLTGGRYFDYRELSPSSSEDAPLFHWREKFNGICMKHSVTPSTACVKFAMSAPGIVSIALNTSNPERVRENAIAANMEISSAFWNDMKTHKLISRDYPYL
ncbi:MAG: L-fucose dehydrogenase [Lentisphaerae bacterium GWF2_50_93]|nr:MAG: L-fucose dehydrogenase [Lentisphaerae bacterium GWF2_50_93]